MKTLLFGLLLTVGGIISVAAQSPDILWQQSPGGSSTDKAYWIETVPAGGFITGGISASGISGDKTENNMGLAPSNDYWVLRLDEDGNVLWQNTIGGGDDDQLAQIKPTADGGFIAGGSSKSNISGDKTVSHWGEYDYWMVKLNSAGGISWQKRYGSTGAEVLTQIEQTDDGGYLLAGISGGDISGDKTEDARGDVDYWIIKTNAAGIQEWQRTIGGNKEDYLYAAFQTPDGGYMVGGSSKSTPSGERTIDLVGTSDMWFLKLDADGNIEWQESIGSNSKDRLNRMCATPDGGYLIAGYSAGNIFADKTENSMGLDFWVLKLNSTGEIVWQNTIGSLGIDLLNTAAPTAEGGLVAVGSSDSEALGYKSESPFGGFDYWVVEIDASGNIVWEKTIGGTENDEPFGVCITPEGHAVVAGYSLSGISGNKTTATDGAEDFWLVSLGYAPAAAPCSAAPDGLYTDNLSPTTAKLLWNADPGAVKYKVQYRQTGVAAWTNTNAVSNVKNLFSLSPSTTYEFRVKSICGGGLSSGWSEIEMFATAPLRLNNTLLTTAFQLYPNPAHDILFINMSGYQNSNLNYIIKDFSGRTLDGGNLENGKPIPIPHLPAGVYWIMMEDGSGQCFVKE